MADNVHGSLRAGQTKTPYAQRRVSLFIPVGAQKPRRFVRFRHKRKGGCLSRPVTNLLRSSPLTPFSAYLPTVTNARGYESLLTVFFYFVGTQHPCQCTRFRRRSKADTEKRHSVLFSLVLYFVTNGKFDLREELTWNLEK